MKPTICILFMFTFVLHIALATDYDLPSPEKVIIETVYEKTWEEGWVNLKPYWGTNEKQYLFQYNTISGRVTIQEMDENFSLKTRTYDEKWKKGWNVVEFLNGGYVGRELFYHYNHTNNLERVSKVSNGEIGKNTASFDHKNKWTGCISYNFKDSGSYSYVMIYDLARGVARFNRVPNGLGKLVDLGYKLDWGKDLVDFATVMLNNELHILGLDYKAKEIIIGKVSTEGKTKGTVSLLAMPIQMNRNYDRINVISDKERIMIGLYDKQTGVYSFNMLRRANPLVYELEEFKTEQFPKNCHTVEYFNNVDMKKVLNQYAIILSDYKSGKVLINKFSFTYK